jgi:hypothetical protein
MTVQVQMFLPPAWLSGSGIHGFLGFRAIRYMSELAMFRDVVKVKEEEIYSQGSGEEKMPLSKLWNGIYRPTVFSSCMRSGV